MLVNEGFMIRRLEIDELKSIYYSQIKKDFPRNERRPFHLLRKLHNNGRYLCLVYEEENQIIAYATFIHDEAKDSVLLDYFAVSEKRRGGGIGSKFITLVCEQWSDKAGIIIECETPDLAKNEGDRDLRKRRIDFYLRAGAESTHAKWRMFGVAYDILWMPTNPKRCQPDVICDIAELYALSLPISLRPLFIRSLMKANGELL